jgi:hypothetical protein
VGLLIPDFSIADFRVASAEKANWQSPIRNRKSTRYRVVVLTSFPKLTHYSKNAVLAESSILN